MVSPFDSRGYKEFLAAWIADQPHNGHGAKAVLARAAQCQTAYISQVMGGRAQLSAEQLERIATHIGLRDEETRFLLLLLQKDRAGTPRLRELFDSEIKAILQKRTQLKNRLSEKTKIGPEELTRYFSSWIYPALHLTATLKTRHGTEVMAKRFGLPLKLVQDALAFLESAGLVEKTKSGWRASQTRMHLPHDSPMISRHHINWRLQAIRDIERQRERSLHYSSIVSISKEDAEALREQLLQTIERAKTRIKDSPEELLYSFCLDFFEL
jgi:uncharacterized protein (TIGR02147 family)